MRQVHKDLWVLKNKENREDGCQGLPGPQGPQGVQGETGPQGPTGVNMATGSISNISFSEGNVNIGLSTNDNSAVLTINSQTQGVLLPSMSEAERFNYQPSKVVNFQNDETVGFITIMERLGLNWW